MELATFQYRASQGWNIKDFPELDSDNTFVLAFSAPEFIDQNGPLKELAKHYPKSKLIGCSSAGEIAGPDILDHSISVAVARLEHTAIKAVATEIKDATDSFAAGERIANLLQNEKLKGIFLLSDGLNVNGSELIRGVNSIVSNDVTVTGGLAGDGDRFKQTWAIFAGEIKLNTIVAIGFYGDHIQIGHGSQGGWDVFGPERVITRSKNNILYALDNSPALDLYKEYLGERAAGLPATGLLFPLAIRKDKHDAKQLVRTILSIDEKEKSLTFAGDVPTGYLAQLMRANFDRLVMGATKAAEYANQVFISQQNKPVLSVAISCVGRRLLLGDRTEEETESTLSVLPKGTQQLGFYSYGELSPYATGTCDLHNQTMTLTTFSET